MNNRVIVPAAVLLATLGSLASSAHAGQVPDRATLDGLLGANQVFEDFESLVGTPYSAGDHLDSETVLYTGGDPEWEGPGLVEPGAAYEPEFGAPTSYVHWHADGELGLSTRTLRSGDTTLKILYDPPVNAIGLDLLGALGYPYHGTVDVWDAAGDYIGTTKFQIDVGGGGESVFWGWEHAGGISRIALRSPNYPSNPGISPIIDNHAYGVIPGDRAPTPPCPPPSREIIEVVQGDEDELITDRATLETLLGAGQIFEDFESLLGSLPLDETGHASITCNTIIEFPDETTEGPDLVEAGVMYHDEFSQSGQVLWQDDGDYELQSRTLGARTNTIGIYYAYPMSAVGLELRGRDGLGFVATIDVYDADYDFLSTTEIQIAAGGAESVFWGWHHREKIGRLEIRSPYWEFSPIIDNHAYGEVASPTRYTVTIDLSGMNSIDHFEGYPNWSFDTNDSLYVSLPLLAGDSQWWDLTGLAWNVNIETVGESWLSDMGIAVSDNKGILGHGAGVSFFPAYTPDGQFNHPGSGTFDSGGIVSLVSQGQSIIKIGPLYLGDPEGIVAVELFEGYEDAAGEIEGHYLAGSTLTLELDPLDCLIGDMDCDMDVDAADFDVVAGCIAGPGTSVAPGCEPSDFDMDADADLADFAEFQRRFGIGR